MTETSYPKLKFKSWKNQYIDLVEQSSSDIISITEAPMPVEKKEQLAAAINKFSGTVLEIGSGSGGHLIEQARRAPDLLHIGIEMRFKRAFRTMEKAKQASINNLLMLRGDARLIEHVFEASSLKAIYINFPDPWDKPRWFKNRILNLPYIQLLCRLLAPGALLSHKSDHQGYFKESCRLLTTCPELKVESFTENLYASEFATQSVPSEFELLFKSQSLPIGYITLRKK